MSHVKKVNRFIPKKGVSLISMTLSLPSCPFGLINFISMHQKASILNINCNVFKSRNGPI